LTFYLESGSIYVLNFENFKKEVNEMIDKERNEIKEIIYKRTKYGGVTLGEAQRLAEKIGLQSVCDGNKKEVRVSLCLLNNK
jgi:hypothetical protein